MKENMADGPSNTEGNPSNPETPKNPENLGKVSTGDPLVDGILGLDNFNKVREGFFSNPANKQAYDTGDKDFKDAIDRQLIEQAGLMGGIGGVDLRRGLGRTPGPGEIAVDTPYGVPRNIEGYSDKDMNQNFQKMRQVMINIESTRMPDGGDVNKEQLMDLSMVINHLRKKIKISSELSEEDKKEMVSKVENLYQEFTARLNLHGLFLQFTKSNDADSVNALFSQVSKEDMNLFLTGRYKDHSKSDLLVWQAFQLYEQNAEVFLKARGTDIDKVREEKIKDALSSPNGELSEADKKSAQIIAEKLWSLLGRRAVKDQLVNKKYPTSLATEEEKQSVKNGIKNKDGKFTELEFEGEASGGNFVLRRILSVEDWLISQGETARPYLKLFRNVDLKTNDFLSDLPGQIETFWKRKLYERYIAEGMTIVEARKIADENATQIAIALTGIEKVQKTRINKKGEIETVIKNDKPDLTWLKNNQVDLSRIKWDGREDGQVLRGVKDVLTQTIQINKDVKKVVFSDEEIEKFEGIDFSIFQDNPLSFWAVRKIMSADKARDAMLNKTASFLRSPSEENLKPLVDVFGYQSETAYEVKEILIGNLVGFLASPDASKINTYKMNIAEADSRIFALAQSMGLTKEDALKISKETLGDNGWDNLRIFMGHFGADKGILAFIMELIMGILKQGLNTK